MMLRGLIVEDHESARKLLKELLVRHPDVELVAECEDTASAWPIIADPASGLDVVFLDIDIQTEGERAGMDLAYRIDRLLPPQKIRIVFTTAFPEFALEAHEVQPFGYLVKPINDAKVSQVLHRIRADNMQRPPPVSTLIEIKYRTLVHSEAVWCTRFVPAAEILYVQSDDSTVNVHLLSGEVLVRVNRPLKNWQEPCFMQVHKSFVLNFDNVNGYKKNPFNEEGYKATFTGATKDIPIGKTYEAAFFPALAKKTRA